MSKNCTHNWTKKKSAKICKIAVKAVDQTSSHVKIMPKNCRKSARICIRAVKVVEKNSAKSCLKIACRCGKTLQE